MKKIIALILVLVSVVSLLPLMAFAEGEDAVPTFAEKIAAADEFTTVTLDEDTAGGMITITKSMTIDFNGHFYSVNEANDRGEAFAFKVNGEGIRVHFKNSALADGGVKIGLDVEEEELDLEKIFAIYVIEGTVTIESGTYACKLFAENINEDQGNPKAAFEGICGGTFVQNVGEDKDKWLKQNEEVWFMCFPYSTKGDDNYETVYGVVDTRKAENLLDAQVAITPPNDYIAPATEDADPQFPLYSAVMDGDELLGYAVYGTQKKNKVVETDEETGEQTDVYYLVYLDADGKETYKATDENGKPNVPAFKDNAGSKLAHAYESSKVLLAATRSSSQTTMEDYTATVAFALLEVQKAKCTDAVAEVNIEIDAALKKIKEGGGSYVQALLKAEETKETIKYIPELATIYIIKTQAIQEMQQLALTERTAVTGFALGLNFLVGIFGLKLDQSENLNLFSQILGMTSGLLSVFKSLVK